MTRERRERSRLSTRQRKRSSYAGKTGISWSGTSMLIECTTTTVRSTSPIERNVTDGHSARSRRWSSTNSR